MKLRLLPFAFLLTIAILCIFNTPVQGASDGLSSESIAEPVFALNSLRAKAQNETGISSASNTNPYLIEKRSGLHSFAISCTSTTGINYGDVPIGGTIDSNTTNCYTFTGAVGDLLRLRTVYTSVGRSVNREVIRPDGSSICGPDSVLEMTCTLDQNGTYTIVITYGNNETFTYNLYIQRLNNPVGCTPIAYNDVPISASIIAPETDCFTFNGTVGERVIIRLIGPGSYAYLDLLRPDGTSICGTGGQNDFRCNLDATGLHTILVGTYIGTGAGSYTLYIQRLNPPVGDCASMVFGAPALTGTPHGLQLLCYRFEGAAGDNIRVRVADVNLQFGTPASLKELLRADGSTICARTSLDINCTLDTSGTYTILISDTNLNFNIFVQRLNNPVGCTTIGYGANPVGGATSVGSELNCYTFNGKVGEELRLRLRSGGGVDQELANPDGTILCGPVRADMVCALGTTGQYTVLVGSGGGYTLEIDTNWYVGQHTAPTSTADIGFLEIKVSPDRSRVTEIRVEIGCTRNTRRTFTYYPGLTLPIANNTFFARNIVTDDPSSPSHVISMDINGIFFSETAGALLDEVYGGFNFSSVDGNCRMQWAAALITPDYDLDGWTDSTEVKFGSNTNVFRNTPESDQIPTTLFAKSLCADEIDNDLDGVLDGADSGCPIVQNYDLRSTVVSPAHASPGERITYLVNYSNVGSQNASHILLFSKLDESVRFIRASNGGEYNPVLHSVDWDLGTLASRGSGTVSVSVELVWGIPGHTKIFYSGYLTNLVNRAGGFSATTNVDTAASTLAPAQNLFLNGIGNCTGPNSDKYDEFAGNLNAVYIPIYNQNCGSSGRLGDIKDVLEAYYGHPNSNNGLTNPMLNGGIFGMCTAYSGGTVTLLAAIRDQGVSCEEVVLISPFFWDWNLVAQFKQYGVKRFTVFEGPDDLGFLKWINSISQFGPLPADIRALLDLLIQQQTKLHCPSPIAGINCGHLGDNGADVEVEDLPGIDHTSWIICINNQLTKPQGSTFDCDPRDPGYSATFLEVITADDPNKLTVDKSGATSNENLNFTIDFENEGSGIAYGVYVINTLGDAIDDATIVLPLSEGGIYDPVSRTISWYAGAVGSGGKGTYHFSARMRADAQCGHDAVDSAIVYFPSVPQVTPTNVVTVQVIAPGCDGRQPPTLTPGWQQLNPSGISMDGRTWAGTGYDESSDRLILFGGRTGTNQAQNDLWVLSNASGAIGTPNWSPLPTSGNVPSPRSQHSAVYDTNNNRLIIFGGCETVCTSALSDTWVLSNANGLGGSPSWTELPSASIGRAGHVAAYDAANNRMIVFGGNSGSSGTDLNDVWVLSNANGLGGEATWAQLAPIGGSPSARGKLTSGAYDATSNRLIIFGGGTAQVTSFNDIWVLSNANGLGGTPVWTQLSPSGRLPAPRSGHTVAYDISSNQLLVFGGQDDASFAYYNDLWSLSNANGLGATPVWTRLSLIGTSFIPARAQNVSAYSQTAKHLIIAAGNSGSSALLNDLWVLLPSSQPLELTSSATGTIDRNLLLATDPDTWPQELRYRISVPPLHGTLSLGPNFTQDQINAGDLSYTQTDNGTGKDSFQFEISDGVTTIGPFTFDIRSQFISPITMTATLTATSTQTPTQSPTLTSTSSFTSTATVTLTASNTQTPTQSPTFTGTPSSTSTLTATSTPSNTLTLQPSQTVLPSNTASATSTPASGLAFYRAINIGGPALVIDGHTWEANTSTTPNFATNGAATCNPWQPLAPPTDPSRTIMIQCYREHWAFNTRMTNVPVGSYVVYLYVWQQWNDPVDEVYSITLEGQTISSNFHSGHVAGVWSRLGPWTVAVTDGTLNLTTTGPGLADLSGLEVYTLSGAPLPTTTSTPTRTNTPNIAATPSSTPSRTITPSATNVAVTATPSRTSTRTLTPSASLGFYRAYNLNGPAISIDGHQWLAGSTSDLTVENAAPFCNQSVTLVPPTDTNRAQMIRCSVTGTVPNITIDNVANGFYDVYLYIWEDNNPSIFSITVQGGQVYVPNLNSGTAGSWQRFGPYTINVTGGWVSVDSNGGQANFSGIELYRR